MKTFLTFSFFIISLSSIQTAHPMLRSCAALALQRAPVFNTRITSRALSTPATKAEITKKFKKLMDPSNDMPLSAPELVSFWQTAVPHAESLIKNSIRMYNYDEDSYATDRFKSALTMLHKAGADFSHYDTLVAMAVRNSEILSHLVNLGAPVNSLRNQMGFKSPLLAAIMHNRPDYIFPITKSVAALLNAGADPKQHDGYINAYHAAVLIRDEEILKMLLKNRNRYTQALPNMPYIGPSPSQLAQEYARAYRRMAQLLKKHSL